MLVCLGGCSSGSSIPKSYPVTGTVKYNGQVVDGADVTFTPISEDGNSRSASGKTDAQGKFSLKTYYEPGKDLPGALAGTYQVTVSKRELPAGGQAEMMRLMQSGQPVPQPKDLLPVQYAAPTTSGFQRSVSATEANDIPLDLTD